MEDFEQLEYYVFERAKGLDEEKDRLFAVLEEEGKGC